MIIVHNTQISNTISHGEYILQALFQILCERSSPVTRLQCTYCRRSSGRVQSDV